MFEALSVENATILSISLFYLERLCILHVGKVFHSKRIAIFKAWSVSYVLAYALASILDPMILKVVASSVEVFNGFAELFTYLRIFFEIFLVSWLVVCGPLNAPGNLCK